MDFKQQFSKQITKLNVKTSAFLEETKTKTYINTLQAEIQELKTAAGEISYNAFVSGKDESVRLTELYHKIYERYQTIQQQEKLMEQQAERNMQVLGNTQPIGPAPIFCPTCGERYTVPIKFCRKCGTKLQ